LTLDTLRYAYKTTQLSRSSNGVVNQYWATTTITPQSNYIQVGSEIVAVYREYASDNTWYDSASHQNQVDEDITGMVDGININTNLNNISFTISLENEVMAKIQIFDLTGREEAQLFNGKLHAGENDLSFDLNMSSDNYIFLLTTSDRTTSEKISLFR